jgi:hypothetical protein
MSKQDCSCRSACLDVPDPALSFLSPLLAHPALPSPSIALGPGTSTPDNLRWNAPKFPFSLLLQKLKRAPDNSRNEWWISSFESRICFADEYRKLVIDKATPEESVPIHGVGDGEEALVRPHWAKEWDKLQMSGVPAREYLKTVAYKDKIVEFKDRLAEIGAPQGWGVEDLRSRFLNGLWDGIIFL